MSLCPDQNTIRAVDPATYMPQPTRVPDLALAIALDALGVSSGTKTTLRRNGGYKHLGPFAELFGASALLELLSRLHYSEKELLTPPENFTDSTGTTLRDLRRTLLPGRLAARLLLCVPGHFRELARRTHDPVEAHALESAGWALAGWLRDRLAAETKVSWWIPRAPAFSNTTAFIAQAPSTMLSLLGRDFATSGRQDKHAEDLRSWQDGPAGRQWAREVGAASSSTGNGPGLPFYADVMTGEMPQHVDISGARSQIAGIWKKMLDDMGPGDPANLADILEKLWNDLVRNGTTDQEKIGKLTRGDPESEKFRKRYFGGVSVELFARIGLGGLELAYIHPSLVRQGDARRVSTVVLKELVPTFSRLFETAYQLGWNDLIFQTAGTVNFRGKKSDAKKTPLKDQLARARQLSNHAFGAAIDINNNENDIKHNEPGTKNQATNIRIDPRVISIFRAFGFTYLGCNQKNPDPMHFEYR